MVTIAKPKLIAKIWPSGDFSVGITSTGAPKKTEPVVKHYCLLTHSLYATKEVFLGILAHTIAGIRGGMLSPLGSSPAPNSHRAKRGEKGISGYGKKMVRSVCCELERYCDRSCLSFGTVTLPQLSTQEYEVICEQWPNLLRTFLQRLTRALARFKLPPYVVHVTEIQSKRMERYGGLPLHLHFVFCGRLKGFTWKITPSMLREWWSQSLQRCLKRQIQSIALENLQRVKKSVSSYLGKYLSKGEVALRQVKKSGWSGKLPPSWWGASKMLKSFVKSSIVSSERLGRYLMDCRQDLVSVGMVVYIKEVIVDMADGQKALMGVCGRFTPEWAETFYLQGIADKCTLVFI